MSTNAAHTLHPTTLAPSTPHRPGLHERTTFGEEDIRVIAGGRCRQVPLHARAIPSPLNPLSQQDGIARLRASMRGVSFDLNTRERAFAFGAGVLFAIVALTAALV